MRDEQTTLDLGSTFRSCDKHQPSALLPDSLMVSPRGSVPPNWDLKQSQSPRRTQATLCNPDSLLASAQLLSAQSPFTLQSLITSQRHSLHFAGDSSPAQLGLQAKLKAVELELRCADPDRTLPPQQRKWSLSTAAVEAQFVEETADEVRDIPQLKWCASCQRETIVKCEFKPSAKTFWSSVAILAMGGVLGCFMVPYMTDSCKRPQFTCTHCLRSVD